MKKTEFILVDCNAFTVSEQLHRTDAIAISDGRIVALGKDAHVLPASWPRISIDGSTVLPGLIDSHCHLTGGASRRLRLELSNKSGLAGILAQVRKWTEAHREEPWIIGGGWDESMWDHPVTPTRIMLDEITGNRPAVLFRRDGHSAWLNSAAFSIIDLGCELPDAFIPLDDSGEYVGLVRETAVNMLSPYIPPVSEDSLARAILTVQDEMFSYGITGVHTFDTETRYPVLRSVRNNDLLKLRVYPSIEHASLETVAELPYKAEIQGYKLYLDGSLGSHTALTVEPDAFHSYGHPIMESNHFDWEVANALSMGMDVLVHAIGDGAVRMALDAFEKHGPSFPQRIVRVEHAQLVHPEDFDRLKMANLAVSIQPCHLLNDIELAERIWAPQIGWSYAYKTMRKHGARLLMGTDYPIESIDPWRNMFVAMHRGYSRESSWRSEECLPWDDVLVSYTALPASVAGWHDVGRLEPGLSATLIIVAEDPGHMSSFDQTVHVTMIDGEVVFSDGFIDL